MATAGSQESKGASIKPEGPIFQTTYKRAKWGLVGILGRAKVPRKPANAGARKQHRGASTCPALFSFPSKNSMFSGSSPVTSGWAPVCQVRMAGPLGKLVKADAGLGKGWEPRGGAGRGSRVETGLEHPGHCQGEGTVSQRFRPRGALSSHLRPPTSSLRVS